MFYVIHSISTEKQYIKLNRQKDKNMEFFKSTFFSISIEMGSGGDKGSGKANLFGGMKIKGPSGSNAPVKDQKPSAVQSETSLVITSKKDGRSS